MLIIFTNYLHIKYYTLKPAFTRYIYPFYQNLVDTKFLFYFLQKITSMKLSLRSSLLFYLRIRPRPISGPYINFILQSPNVWAR